MSQNLLPLIALWLWSRSSSSAAPLTRNAAPRWPTPASPPPMPAFESTPTPSADPSHSSTPLADLHNRPPELAPASSTQPGHIKIKKKATVLRSQAQQRADNAVRNFLTPKSDTALSVPVREVQQILLRRGVKIAPDGMYGPRTATAWSRLAQSKGLPTTIARVSPKIAKVVTRTYDSLSVPAIP